MNYTVPPKNMLIMNILDILKRYSDEDHRLSQKDIIEILEKEYSMKVDRKAIKRNLMNLIDFGYDIEFSESVRTNKKGESETLYTDWYISREFDNSELRLLIDSLLFSKHLPYSQCKRLIEKLEGLSSIYFKPRVAHIRNMPENRPENKQLFFTIDVLDKALSQGKQVAFYYNRYDVDKKLHPTDDKKHIINPYQIVATNGRYYLICNKPPYANMSNYRMDRITDIEILDSHRISPDKIKGYEHGLDLSKHMAESIYMFSGESVRVKFKAQRYLAGDIIDWFGSEIQFENVTEEDMTVTVKVNEYAMFYWAMQYGEHVEVIQPASLREKISGVAKSLCEKYSCSQQKI